MDHYSSNKEKEFQRARIQSLLETDLSDDEVKQICQGIIEQVEQGNIGEQSLGPPDVALLIGWDFTEVALLQAFQYLAGSRMNVLVTEFRYRQGPINFVVEADTIKEAKKLGMLIDMRNLVLDINFEQHIYLHIKKHPDYMLY